MFIICPASLGVALVLGVHRRAAPLTPPSQRVSFT